MAPAMSPNLCPQCLAQNIIATANGPTCTHQPNADALWFPSWWLEPAGDVRRVNYINTHNAEPE